LGYTETNHPSKSSRIGNRKSRFRLDTEGDIQAEAASRGWVDDEADMDSKAERGRFDFQPGGLTPAFASRLACAGLRGEARLTTPTGSESRLTSATCSVFGALCFLDRVSDFKALRRLARLGFGVATRADSAGTSGESDGEEGSDGSTRVEDLLRHHRNPYHMMVRTSTSITTTSVKDKARGIPASQDESRVKCSPR
jgi:hypothetical protein